MVCLVQAANSAGGAYGSIGGKKGSGLGRPFGVILFLSSCSEARGPAGTGRGGGSCRWVLMPGGRTGI